MNKRTFSFVFIFSIFIGLNYAASPLAASSNIGVEDKLKNATDFKLLTPYYSPSSFKLEIKEPFPLVLGRSISKVRLHYFDKLGKTYMFGIEEHKADGYNVRRVETIIDVHNQTSTEKTIVEEFKFDVRGEKININGIEARFVPWANHKPGGYLRWVQDGTFIEIDSGVLTKEMMVELAKSMK
ncbi:DUF4367 domain-containing protein [Paenibacillus sp. GCM10027629]|uniref:DUF4367 domain-containing protein n=1 Tax=Paenibacillus sp. GCM10027629 TaxID=3273414 RepID=UPI0036367E14